MIVFLAAVVVLLIHIGISLEFRAIAEMKGYSEWKYFWWCFGASIAGYLMVVALPARSKEVPAVSDELPEL